MDTKKGYRKTVEAMGRQLHQIAFEDWLDFLFDHPITDPEWYWTEDADSWDGSPTETVQHLTRTFRESGTALLKYSDAQLNQGLWYLASNSCSEVAYSLLDERVAWDLRKGCIETIGDLFAQCFSLRCSNHLSHLDEPGANPLNSICYMWWDVLPIHGKPDDPSRKETDETFLRVMERILELPSDACREAALHGLGEWQCYYPGQVHDIVYRFIWKNRHIRDSLRNYAYAAQHGDVL